MNLGLNLRNRPFAFTSMVLLTIALLFFLSSILLQHIFNKENSKSEIMNFTKGWQYSFEENIDEKQTFKHMDLKLWKNYNISGKPFKADGKHKTIWLRVKLPGKHAWENPVIFFDSVIFQYFEAYIDGQKIYHRNSNITMKLHHNSVYRDRFTLPLIAGYEDKLLYIRIFSEGNNIGPYREIKIGTHEDIVKTIARKDFDNLILGFFFFIFGLFILPNVVFVDSKERKTLIYFCFSMITLGIYFISSTYTPNIVLIQDTSFWIITNTASCTTMVASFMAFFKQVFLNESNNIIVRIWNINIFLYIFILICAIPSLTTNIIDYSIISLFTILLILADLIAAIIITINKAMEGNIDAKIFCIGFIIYGAIALGELSVFMINGRVPILYKWCMLIFIAALVLILGRRSSETHNRLVIYSTELENKNSELHKAWDELKKSKDEMGEFNMTLEHRVTERTQQLKDAMDILVRTQDQLIRSEKMAALGGLVAGVAHEINTPVGIGITAASHLETETQGIAELYQNNKMKRSDFDNYISMCVQSSGMILSNLKRAADLIKSFKKVAVDQSSEERRTFKIGDYINEVLISLRPEIKRTNHQLVVNCPDDLELDSFPGAFSQVVTNLVMNSIIHAYNEGEAGTLKFDIRKSSKNIIIEYSDNGKGIKKDLLPKIFDPFFTTNRSNGGTGLGLNVVYNIITQTLKGTIICESEEGKGVTFIIKIPY